MHPPGSLCYSFTHLQGLEKGPDAGMMGIFESGIRMPIDTVGVQMSVHLTVLKLFLVKL